MKTTPRSILSAIGISLAAVTAVTVLFIGIAAPVTVTAFSSLVVYGIFEIAAIDYTPIPLRRVRVAARSTSTSSKVIAFPATNRRRAA